MLIEYIKIDNAFKLPSKSGYGGFPTTCMECGAYLNKNSDLDYGKDWTATYTCEKCESKFAYQPSDMGQSLPWIVKYDNKNEIFNKDLWDKLRKNFSKVYKHKGNKVTSE